MATLIELIKPEPYYKPSVFGNRDEWKRNLSVSVWVYIGNLSFFTSESQIYALFSTIDSVRQVVLGLNKITKTPCGFGFVEFTNHEAAVLSVELLDESKLDDRIIKVELDPGFTEDRKWGRAQGGGQVRDELRPGHDPGRGGQWGDRKDSNYIASRNRDSHAHFKQSRNSSSSGGNRGGYGYGGGGGRGRDRERERGDDDRRDSKGREEKDTTFGYGLSNYGKS
jgi:nuclear cap-binding protein subunit 2